LDCKQGGAYQCGHNYIDLYSYFLLREYAYTTEAYPGKFTGIPSECKVPHSFEENRPKFKLPVVINNFDIGLEDTLQHYTASASIKISTEIV